VLFEPVVDKVFVQDRPNGTAQTSGRLVVRLTHVGTGKSVIRQINGPVFIDRGGTTVRLSGVSLVNVFAGNDAVGVTGGRGFGLFIVNGPSTFSNGVLTQIGHVQEDLCATLA
jgi:hypothetical protein